MWIYVLLGNVLRGIGETPVQPLGISYIDDFATEENAALYVGKTNNSTMSWSKVVAEVCQLQCHGFGLVTGLRGNREEPFAVPSAALATFLFRCRPVA